MNEQQSAEIVTIKEAIEKVKKWSEEKDYTKVKEGCEEILAVEPDNAEIKALLETANKELGEATAAPEPSPAPEVEQMDVEAAPEPASEAPVEAEKPAEQEGPKAKPPIGMIILLVVLVIIIGGVLSQRIRLKYALKSLFLFTFL